MGSTKIEWTDKVWNPVTGCTKVSAGCKNCYAERMSKRFKGSDGFKVTLHQERLEEPLRWRKPSKIFVCSMGDLFHVNVPFAFVDKVITCIRQSPQHIFLILTKRPHFMKEYFEQIGEINNLWLGVSVEDQKTADERIPLLLKTLAAKRFVSYEPALGPVDFKPYIRIAWQCSYCRGYFPDPLKEICPSCNKKGGWTGSHVFNPPSGQRGSGLNWVIMGGESGLGARPMHPDWARSARDQCKAAGIPFFFKQWGEYEYFPPGTSKRGRTQRRTEFDDGSGYERVGKRAAGCLLDVKEYKEIPK